MRFEEYRERYEFARMRREERILELALHTEGAPLVWDELVHRRLGELFHDIAADSENRVLILTGTGDTFCSQVGWGSWKDLKSPNGRHKLYVEGKQILQGLLNIEALVVTAVNGPAHQHAELAAMGDIVLASETASFRDPHFSEHGRVPGDGSHVIWQLLLGVNRAKYFHLTGQVISANEAQRLGVVNEIIPSDRLLPRAWEVANQLVKGSELLLKHSRIALNLRLRREIEADFGFGFALENLAALADFVPPGEGADIKN